MCLSLDHFTSPIGSCEVHPRGCKREIKEHLHLVRSSWDGRNRFMDKPLSFIVDPLTRAGAMGEHSPVDALVPSIVTEYALVKGVSHESFLSPPEAVTGELSDGSRRLGWIADDRTERELRGAEERAMAMITDSDDNVFHFSAYGADWIKAQGQSRHVLFTIHTAYNMVLTNSPHLLNSQPGFHQTRTYRWLSNLRGSEQEGPSQRHTRPLSHGYFSMGERRPSEH